MSLTIQEKNIMPQKCAIKNKKQPIKQVKKKNTEW